LGLSRRARGPSRHVDRGDAAYAADTAALATAPNDPAANLDLATIALYHNDLDAAARHLARATATPTDDPRAQRIFATIAQRHADTEPVAGAVLPARIPFVAEDPLPLISVEVNGRKGLFIVDTGAGATTLDPDFAAEVGVTLSAAGSGVFAGGRQAALQRGTAATVQVGGVTMHDVNVMGLPTRQVPFFGERKPDGVIGTRFFTHFLTTLDYVNGALILRPRTDSAAFEREAGPNSVPMLWVGDALTFDFAAMRLVMQ
jgi:Aspartyl protease